MITGDEGKPMSFLEYISDEPCEPEQYINYLLDHYRGHREYWASVPDNRDPDKPTARACVLIKIDFFIIELEKLKRKMHRSVLPVSSDAMPTEEP